MPNSAPSLPDKAELLARVQPHRTKWDMDFRPEGLESVAPGEESVWEYPRPPIVVPAPVPMKVVAHGELIASSSVALEVKERAGAPVPYFPPSTVETAWLEPNGAVTTCEWKGAGVAYDLVVPGHDRIVDAAWNYPDPLDDLPENYAQIAGWFAFYPAKVECFVGDGAGGWEAVVPQPGAVYGGWMSSRIKGPVKGEPGTQAW